MFVSISVWQYVHSSEYLNDNDDNNDFISTALFIVKRAQLR